MMMVRSKARMYGAIAAMVFMTGILFLATAEAGNRTKDSAMHDAGCYWTENSKRWVCPDGVNPKHTPPGSGIGGCNKDGTLCWNIDIGTPKHGLPVELYGSRARNLIANGQISHANMSPYGVFHLNVWSGYHNSYFDCDVDVSRRTFHCVQEW